MSMTEYFTLGAIIFAFVGGVAWGSYITRETVRLRRDLGELLDLITEGRRKNQ